MREYKRRPYQYTRLHSPVPLTENAPAVPKTKEKKRYSRKIIILACLISLFVAFLAIGAFFALRLSDPPSLPSDIVDAVHDFHPYYFSGNTPPAQFKLKEDTISYLNGVLVFSLTRANGQSISISEQKAPEEFLSSPPQGDENFSTNYGKATLSTVTEGRITGSLVTSDDTLILINTSDPITTNTIKDILQALSPL